MLCSDLFAGDTDNRSFAKEAGLDADADDDRVTRVEYVFWVDAEFAREDGQVLELVAFCQQPLLAELGEPVEQMVDDVSDKDVDAFAVRLLLGLAFHLHVERHYHSISTQHMHNSIKSFSLVAAAVILVRPITSNDDKASKYLCLQEVRQKKENESTIKIKIAAVRNNSIIIIHGDNRSNKIRPAEV